MEADREPQTYDGLLLTIFKNEIAFEKILELFRLVKQEIECCALLILINTGNSNQFKSPQFDDNFVSPSQASAQISNESGNNHLFN